MAEELPRVEFTIDSGDPEQGIKTVSLVDEPAIQSDFIFFNKETEKPKFIKLEVEDYKNTVFGAVLIPDKDILRVDENGNPYNGYFSKETIEELRNKFHKEMQTSKVNEDHDEEAYLEAYLNESYIINSDERLADAETKGLVDITMGSWIASYKIEDDEVFQKVVDGELNGFSIEAFLNREFKKVTNNKENNKLKIMKNKLIERLTALVEEFAGDEEEVKVVMERNSTVDGEMFEWNAVGEPVMIVSISEDTGEESLEPAVEGEYEFEDGAKIVVDGEGNLVEFVAAPEVEEPTDEEAAKLKEEEEAKLKEEEAKAAEEGEEVKAEDGADTKKTLEELIDLSQDGWYTVEVGVEGGEISYGAVYANTWKDLDLKITELETLKAEKIALEAKVEELNATVLAAPVTEQTEGAIVKEETVDLSKLTNYEKVLRRNKIDF